MIGRNSIIKNTVKVSENNANLRLKILSATEKSQKTEIFH